MFLSQWQLYMTPELVRNPYEIHRLLWQAFPGMPESPRPFLFRLEGRPQSRFRTVLMQSTCEPSPVTAEPFELLGSKTFGPRFQAGQQLAFRVCANPVKRLKQDSRRVPLIREEEQIAWLQRQLEKAAQVEPGEVRMEQQDNLYFRKSGKPGKVATVTFAGHLTVTNPADLLAVLEHGIGPAKCFGCGLLSLARLS